MAKKKKKKEVITEQTRLIVRLWNYGYSSHEIKRKLSLGKDFDLFALLNKKEIQAFSKTLEMDEKEITERVIKRVTAGIEQKIAAQWMTEKRVQIDQETGKQFVTVIKKAYTTTDLVNIAKLNGVYQPTLRVKDIKEAERNDKDINIKLIEQVKKLSTG